MTSKLAGNEPASEYFGFFLLPQFSMMSFAAVIEPLRMANRLAGRELYRWDLFGKNDETTLASNGLGFAPTRTQADAKDLSALLVVAGIDVHLHREPGIRSWLRSLARSGVRLGATSTGSMILARSGLLDGYRCTIHWENLESFREEFPAIQVSADLYEIDRGRLTCSGGSAGLDLMLHLIRERHGRDLAAAVAEQCLHPDIREARSQQRMALRARLDLTHPRLLAVIHRMETNLDQPSSCDQLAAQCGLSLRQMERLFNQFFRTTPGRYYQNLRLERARALLLQTERSIVEIAAASGFVSASHFAKCYRERFGRTPRQERGRPGADAAEPAQPPV